MGAKQTWSDRSTWWGAEKLPESGSLPLCVWGAGGAVIVELSGEERVKRRPLPEGEEGGGEHYRPRQSLAKAPF